MGWAVACGVMALVLVGSIVHYERSLRRMERWLKDHELGSGERVVVDSLSPGLRSLGAAVDGLLAAERTEREQDLAERKAFKSDLASLSHDIRTPLAGAAGYLELYETRTTPEDRDRCVRIARERLGAMHGLVDDLFKYSMALEGASEMVSERVELLPLVAQVLLGLYPAFAERGWEPVIDFEDEGLVVVGDPEALRRVFSNLAANALRHGAGAPRVAQRDRRVVMRNPVEHPEAIDADRLFERFYRSDVARGGGGSGLGLAIVAQLCAAMGMQVGARVVGDQLEVWVDLG